MCVTECVFASDYLCASVWEPHLSGEPEGSIERAIMSVYMSICERVSVCVCETDIVKGISLRHTALKSVGHVILLCPNCFPLLTQLVIMPFSLSHTHMYDRTYSHSLSPTLSSNCGSHYAKS